MLSRRSSRRLLTVWATLWSVLLTVVFVGVTALTLVVWFTDPQYTETTPVGDLSFFALGMMIAAGVAAQRENPDRNIAGVQQAGLATLSLGLAGLLGNRIEPLVGSVLFLAVVGVTASLHPSGRDLFRAGDRPSVPLGVLAILAAVPAVLYAADMLELAAGAGPSCFLGQCAAGDRLAEMAAAAMAIVVVGLLAALRSRGWRLALWSAGLPAITIGSVSLALPEVSGSLGRTWGVVAVAWGVLFLVSGEWQDRRTTSADG